MRSISFLLLLVFSCQLSFGKAVDAQTAKTTAYGFCKSEGIAVNPTALSLVYTATSIINSATVNDFYIFSLGSTGFVIISGDDNVIPVLGYSAESPVNADNMPSNFVYWLDNYKNQINHIIEKGTTSTSQSAKWNELLNNNVGVAHKSTSAAVAPLMHTTWDQMPYYNALCPYDHFVDSNAITGCVATAMAQVMKYWNWPVKGVGSHSYSAGAYGTLTADFGNTTYQWDSMKNYITKIDTAIAVLMFHAGVSVNMNYGVTESGAYVNQANSPIPNCSEYALKNYFRYKVSTMEGMQRYDYDDSDWIHTLRAEMDARRPVLYTGYGSDGGHCFVADGYTTLNRIHFNWGWSGRYNGYYVVESLDPGGTTFNDGQTLLIGIEPDTVTDHVDTVVTPVVSGVTQVATAGALNIYPNPTNDVINIDLAGTKVTRVTITNMDGRELKSLTPDANASIIRISTDGFAEGMYFVRVQTSSGILTKKIIVAR